MTRGAAPGEHGFSLLEVCIAAGLLGTALVNLAVLFTLAIDANVAVRHRTYAAALAAQKLEELRAGADALPVPGAGVELIDRSGVAFDAAAGSDAVFERRWWIDRLIAGPASVIRLQVEVQRHPADARVHDPVVLATLVRPLP